jgi:tetratricopeptide (TPR) repeat protein
MRVASLFVMVSAVCGHVSAQEASPPELSQRDREAQIHFEAGRLHFDNGNYEQALPEFQAAFDLSGRPQLLYNLYITEENLGQLEAAATHLERFLAEGQVAAEQRAQLTERLGNLRRRVEAERASDARAAEAAAAAARAAAEPVYSHEGFFFRAMAGFGFGIASVGVHLDPPGMDAYAGTLRATGTSTSLDLAVGWGFFENLIFQLQIFGTTMLAGEVSASGDPGEEFREALRSGTTKYNALGLLLGATYYFMPINLYVSLAAGLGGATLERPSQSFDDRVGFALATSFGKDWWIGDDWGLGLALSYYLTVTGQAIGRENETLSGHSLGLFIALSYN